MSYLSQNIFFRHRSLRPQSLLLQVRLYRLGTACSEQQIGTEVDHCPQFDTKKRLQIATNTTSLFCIKTCSASRAPKIDVYILHTRRPVKKISVTPFEQDAFGRGFMAARPLITKGWCPYPRFFSKFQCHDTAHCGRKRCRG